MRKLSLWIYVIVLVWLLYDDELPTISSFWYWNSRFWYNMAEFAGRTGMNAEKRYHEMVSING